MSTRVKCSGEIVKRAESGSTRRVPGRAGTNKYSFAVAAIIAAVAPGIAIAQIVHGPKAATDAIVAAETAHSARFGVVGVAKGMREFIDPVDGLAFTGGGDPARGPAVYGAFGGDAPSTLKLSWVPAEVFASAGGDMAASWGRFTMIDTAGRMKPLTGRYVTVWRKAADGSWKAIMDIGNPDTPAP